MSTTARDRHAYRGSPTARARHVVGRRGRLAANISNRRSRYQGSARVTPSLAAAILLSAFCTRSLGTTPSELCPEDPDRCVITDGERVVTSGLINFGSRDLTITSSGKLRLEDVDPPDPLQEKELRIFADDIQIDGTIETDGEVDGGGLIINSTGSLTLSASASLTADGDDSGGDIEITAAALSLLGTISSRATGSDGTATGGDETAGSIFIQSTATCDLAGSTNISAPNGIAGSVELLCDEVIARGHFMGVGQDEGADVDLKATVGALQFLGTADLRATRLAGEDGELSLSAETDITVDTIGARAIDTGEGVLTVLAERNVTLHTQLRTGDVDVLAGYDRHGQKRNGESCLVDPSLSGECARRFGDVLIRAGTNIDADISDGEVQITGCREIQEADTVLRGSLVNYFAREALTMRGTAIVHEVNGGFFVDFRSSPPDLAGACIKDRANGCGSAQPVIVQDSSLIACSCPAQCDDGVQCTIESCNAGIGCVQQIATDGVSCDDGSLCTMNGRCEFGVCVSSPRNCNDANQCTADSCDPASGCVNTPFTGPCSDGNACTLNDTCASGTCSGAPACGSGTIETGCGEQCDGASLGGATCQSLGFDGGALACFPPANAQRCRFDTSLCRRCGNGMLEPGEVCDGSNLGGATCQTQGYSGGTLTCGAGCLSLDESGCFFCGNAQIDPGEECDRENLGGASCNGPGETGGLPQCTLDCRLDRTTCFTCGNGHVDPQEECDDGNVVAGDGCRADCRTECGNGSVERNEECDDGNRAAGDGCSPQCARELPLGGGGARQDCALEWGIEGGQESRRQRCTDGDPLCDRGTTPGRCDYLVFYCFNVAEFVVGEPAACVPRDIAALEIGRSSLLTSNALSAADVDSLLGAMAATLARGGATPTRSGPVLTASPPMSSRRQCGSVVLPVPLRTTSFGTARGRKVLSIEAMDSAGDVDRDTFIFLCEP